MDHALGLLTDLTVQLGQGDHPCEVREAMTELLVDSLACAVGGIDCPAIRACGSLPIGTNELTQSVVLGSRRRCQPDLAAFMTTSMIRYLDFNDLTSAGHPSDILGATIAVGSAVRASGEQVLTASIVGYEVFGRVAEAVIAERKTLDQGYAVAIATAAAVSVLLGSDRTQTQHAIAMAATASVPLRATRSGQLSAYKGAATAVSTRDGTFLAYLANGGMTGPEAPFEGRHGIVELVDGTADTLPLEEAPGRWITLERCLKYFPTAYNMQPSVWAAMQLRATLREDDVHSVHLHTAPFSWHESGSEPEKWDPQTRETADHSLPYVFAHALRHGWFDARAYEPEYFRDPATLALMQRITVTPDWDRGGLAGTVIGVTATATGHSGNETRVVVDQPKGHFANPMTRDEITEKATHLLEPVYGTRTSGLIESSWQIADCSDIDDLIAGFAVPSES